jgi:hypothetical protein
MDRLEELIAKYLDDALPTAEACELADRLRADREASATAPPIRLRQPVQFVGTQSNIKWAG